MFTVIFLAPLVVGVVAAVGLGAYGLVRARYGVAGNGPSLLGAFSREPTSNAVTRDDVAGRWQFYSDAASKTVRLDFRPDGTYGQTIVDNRGQTTHCPGGTWTLFGPHVELTGYVSAREGTTESMTWWMVDGPAGLSLYGGDDPDSFFAMTRIPEKT